MDLRNTEKIQQQYDTLEFSASKLHSREVVFFLKRKCDGLLSTGHAIDWAREIAKIFPDSRLGKSITELKLPVSVKKKRRQAQKESVNSNKQSEMLLSFTFRK